MMLWRTSFGSESKVIVVDNADEGDLRWEVGALCATKNVDLLFAMAPIHYCNLISDIARHLAPELGDGV
jgi:hypothetical protein